MKAVLISIFLSIIGLFFLMENQEKKVVLLIIFMLPFSYLPIHNRIIHSGILIETSGLLVFFVWLAMRLKNKIKMNWKELSPKVNSLYYFLFVGVVLGFIYYGDGVVPIGAQSIFTPTEQIINNSIFIILVILLLKILVNFQYDDLFRSKMAKIFIITIFVNVFSQMLKILGMENILWGFFSPKGLFEIEDVRNLGLFYSFGLGVYVVLIISFSLFYYNKHKSLSIAAITSTLVFSILTGTRQTIVFITVFFILFIFINLLKNKITPYHALSIIFISIFFYFLVSNLLLNTVIFQRFKPAISNIEDGDLLIASGRDAARIPSVLADLSTYPILGKGLLNLYETKNSRTNIAGHVIWFNIYKKFGIIGLIYLLTILIYPIVKLFKICINTKDEYIFKEGAILFSLMVIVFIQQFWDNFFWFSDTMLLYGFVYFWIFSFFNRCKHLIATQEAI